MDLANDLVNWWKARIAAVLACLTLALFLSAFMRTSRIFDPLDAWMQDVTYRGTWIRSGLFGAALIAACLLAKLIVTLWRKP